MQSHKQINLSTVPTKWSHMHANLNTAPITWSHMHANLDTAPTMWPHRQIDLSTAPTMWSHVQINLSTAPTMRSHMQIHLSTAPTMWSHMHAKVALGDTSVSNLAAPASWTRALHVRGIARILSAQIDRCTRCTCSSTRPWERQLLDGSPAQTGQVHGHLCEKPHPSWCVHARACSGAAWLMLVAGSIAESAGVAAAHGLIWRGLHFSGLALEVAALAGLA